MLRFLFHLSSDLTDPNTTSVPFGTLFVLNEQFEKWELDSRFEPEFQLDGDLFLREVVSTFDEAVRLQISEDWPAAKAHGMSFVEWMCKTHEHSSIFVQLVLEGDQTPAFLVEPPCPIEC